MNYFFEKMSIQNSSNYDIEKQIFDIIPPHIIKWVINTCKIIIKKLNNTY